MKRRLEPDTVETSKNQSSLSFLDRKISEYHQIFHLLYGLIDELPQDVIFCIAECYIDLWSIPESIIFNEQMIRTRPRNGYLAISFLISITDETPNTIKLNRMVVEFHDQYRYTIKSTRACVYLTGDTTILETYGMLVYIMIQMTDEIRDEYHNDDMVVHISIDNKSIEVMLRGFDPFYRVCAASHITETTAKEASKYMGLITEHHKPGYVDETKEVALVIEKYTQSVTLSNPYQLIYYNYDGEQETHIRNRLYPLILCLEHHHLKFADNLVLL